MYWLTFVGEGRSGHTIVSGILGSHPHVRISEEQKYISKWLRGMSKEEILFNLNMSGEGKYRKTMKIPNLLNYKDPLLVVGDKCGWDAANEVRKRGASVDILTQFSNFMGMPVKVIHTTRHPLDNITAWVNSSKYERLIPDKDRRFNKMIARYTKFYEVAEKIMENQDVFHVSNEELIKDPELMFKTLCEWLNLPVTVSWCKEAASLVNNKPHRSRLEYEWPDKYVEQVMGYRVLDRFPSLGYYKLNDNVHTN
jgi:hypothetical protein